MSPGMTQILVILHSFCSFHLPYSRVLFLDNLLGYWSMLVLDLASPT
jgi:hypothetical protein